MTTVSAYKIRDQPDTFWAYLAGYVDGEGSISICQNGPRFTIANTHLATLEWIRDSMGFGTISERNAKSMLARRTKPCYNLNAGSNGLRAVLPKIIPFLQEKRPQAEAMMEYLATMHSTPAMNKLPEVIAARQTALDKFRIAVANRWGNESEK